MNRMVHLKNNQLAFTLMELMVVMIIIGVIAAIAVPNFNKVVEQSHESDATTQLMAIHAANQIRLAQTGSYWPTTTTNGLTVINSTLGLNIIANGMNYNCAGVGGTTFTCTATRSTGTAYVVQTTQADIKTGVPNSDTTKNPRCTSGSACPYP